MLIVLPPSEAKSAPSGRSRGWDPAQLSRAELAPERERVLASLIAVSERSDAAELLGVGPSVAAEVARNRTLRSAPGARADRVYSGVLYEAADLAGLAGSSRARAGRDVVIVSALFGALSTADRIPAYRLSMGDLPGLGPLASVWKRPLAEALDHRADRELVVDCRSSAYAMAWRPPSTADWVTVRVLREEGGRRTVVSHNAKHTRGALAGALLRQPGGTRAQPRDAEGLLDAATSLLGERLVDARLVPRPRLGQPSTLELTV